MGLNRIFSRAVLLYALNRALLMVGTVVSLWGHGMSLAKVLYYAFIWSPIHDDSQWFLAISANGYWKEDTAFFPLYPLLIRGLSALGLNPSIAALMVSNIAFILCIGYLIVLSGRLLGEQRGKLVPFLFVIFPMSFYMASAYSESLFILAVLATMYALMDKRYIQAGAWAAVATLTRNTGILLSVAFLFEFLRSYPARQRLGRIVTGAMFAPAALAGYMAYCWVLFGSPLEFSNVERLWGRNFMNPLATVFNAVAKIGYLWNKNGYYGHVYYLFQYGAVFLALAALPTVWKYLPKEWFVITLLMILIPLSDPGIGIQTITLYDRKILDYFFSFDRFTLPMIAVFMALAIRLDKIRKMRFALYPVSALGAVVGSMCMNFHLFIG